MRWWSAAGSKRALARRRGVDDVRPEDGHDGGHGLVPVGTRKDRAQHEIDEGRVVAEESGVEVGGQQGRDLGQLLRDDAREGRPGGAVRARTLPEGDDPLEAQRGGEGERVGGGGHGGTPRGERAR